MKSILMSICPKWIEKIANGNMKTLPAKSVPKCETPFKVHMYCTKNHNAYDLLEWHDYDKGTIKKMNDKVVGEFVCGEIENVDIPYPAWDKSYLNPFLDKSCLTYEELHNYGGSGKRVFGLHISDLKIYDKMKEIEDFNHPCDGDCDCCKYSKLKEDRIDCYRMIEQAPKSWCYVEERR